MVSTFPNAWKIYERVENDRFSMCQLSILSKKLFHIKIPHTTTHLLFTIRISHVYFLFGNMINFIEEKPFSYWITIHFDMSHVDVSIRNSPFCRPRETHETFNNLITLLHRNTPFSTRLKDPREERELAQYVHV